MNEPVYDALVIGAGPAGLVTALALASSGCRTVLAGPPHNPDPHRPDTRTTALLRGSVQLLQNLDVWVKCQPHAAPLEKIRIIDDTDRLLRAPEVCFDSAELAEGPFGYNIPNSALVTELLDRAVGLKRLTIVETAGVTGLERESGHILAQLKEGNTLRARLVAGADGRNSMCRQWAGISTTSWRYPQTALACNFSHSESHENTSNELHGASGPFTTVPLPGNESSLVWVVDPEEAERLGKLSDEQFAEEIHVKLRGALGNIPRLGPRAMFPLSGMRVERYARNRVALVGEAAHVIPPIGAQGLNLGFRDAAALAECAGKAIENDADLGANTVLHDYSAGRRLDVSSRTFTVDLLNRSLMTGYLPLHLARGIGLHLLGNLSPLRRLFMREGISPRTGIPKLMREEPQPPSHIDTPAG